MRDYFFHNGATDDIFIRYLKNIHLNLINIILIIFIRLRWVFFKYYHTFINIITHISVCESDFFFFLNKCMSRDKKYNSNEKVARLMFLRKFDGGMRYNFLKTSHGVLSPTF